MVAQVEKSKKENICLSMLFIGKHMFLFLFGGMLYYFLEIVYRGYSHYSMILCGGFAFVLIGELNEKWNFSVVSQMVIGSLIITSLEFMTGVIFNLGLHENVWDYSLEPYNILGQVCLAYSNMWFLLSFLCIVLDDCIRSYIFGEKKKIYQWL